MPGTCVLDFTRSIQSTHDEHHFFTKIGPSSRSRKIPVTPRSATRPYGPSKELGPGLIYISDPAPVYHHEGRAHSFAQGAPRVGPGRRLRHTPLRPLSSASNQTDCRIPQVCVRTSGLWTCFSLLSPVLFSCPSCIYFLSTSTKN